MRAPLRPATLLAAVTATLILTAAAGAHVERPSYFVDPAPDTTVKPPAGGEVPKARSLRSALNRRLPGTTRVVCQAESLKRLSQSVRSARSKGYEIRPTDRRRLSAKQARRLLRINRRLRRMCRFREIQPAVMASRNNDRVVVMPGVYTEPTARAKPTNDKACDRYRTNGDRPGEQNTALSYAYQVHCPNDQNLIAVLGRAVGSGHDPVPPREDRHGIPNVGECIRCNLQLEGSGVSADDVIIDAGDASKGNGGPNGVGAKKDVVVRADRADGFVLRNVNVRHAGEHGIYVHETDGYLLDRFKAFYNRLYGTLSFTSDHGRQQNCEGVGHGDSALYPGGAPETGVQRPPGTEPRFNQEIRWCDLHHNMAGWSGTNGNGVHTHHNNFYDNSIGIQTDVVTGAGHPGYPGDSSLFEDNRIYSNNFDTYAPSSDVVPSFPFPVGTGMWIAGGNHHKVRGNWFYDNWRRGTMVFSVPDSLVCGAVRDGHEQAGCDAMDVTTSHYNQTFENHMGIRPDGTPDRNGTDFWWDQFPGSRGNCWFHNRSPTEITSSPPGLPGCDGGADPAQSVGTGNPVNESELLICAVAFETRNEGGLDPNNSPCPWLRRPADPGDGRAESSSMRSTRFYRPADPIADAQRAPRRGPVPLGQANCTDWNRASAAGRAGLAERLRVFAGGVVNTGSRDVGTGAVLSAPDTHRLYDAWCARDYARGFLLYKLYTHAAAFARRL